MIKVKVHDYDQWVPPICHVCNESVGMTYFIKATGPLCAACEGKLRKAKRKKRKK